MWSRYPQNLNLRCREKLLDLEDEAHLRYLPRQHMHEDELATAQQRQLAHRTAAGKSDSGPPRERYAQRQTLRWWVMRSIV